MLDSIIFSNNLHCLTLNYSELSVLSWDLSRGDSNPLLLHHRMMSMIENDYNTSLKQIKINDT